MTDTNTFQNDMISFQNKDDVITLLIHLGYLAYDQKYRKAFISNEEIRQEFVLATKSKKWNELLDFQRESKELLEATLDMDCDTVAEKIEKNYVQAVSNYTGTILLVGIAYDKKTKVHECEIVKNCLLP